MHDITDYPAFVFLAAFLALWLSARAGAALNQRRPRLDEGARADYGVVQAAALTLLGLIIGFSFSMALSRYDQRKGREAEEANAIGTEYVRADLLPPAAAAGARGLLKSYLQQRILFYETRDAQHVERINARTAGLQAELWAAVQAPGAGPPTPLLALATAGMNDVLNSQGYAQAACWNRIPTAAWGLMATIAVGCNFLLGYGLRNVKADRYLLLVLPLLVAISFLLIADIDSPHGGLIRLTPRNLLSLADALGAP